MALAEGTVSIHPTTGAVSGSGFARALYDAEAIGNPTLSGDLDAAVDTLADDYATKSTSPASWEDGGAARPGLRASILATRQATAAKASALAAAHVALVGTGTVIVPPGAGGGTFPVL